VQEDGQELVEMVVDRMWGVFDSCYIKFVFIDLNPSTHNPNKW